MNGILNGKVAVVEHRAECFALTLKVRKPPNYGFLECLNFKMQTGEGRDVMIADLEELDEEPLLVWRLASGLTAAKAVLVIKLRNDSPIE